MIACANCILECLERVTEYINSSAYAYMAITGDSFLTSAMNGFLLNLKHMMKFAVANSIAKVFMFVGKLGIVLGNTFLGYMMMKYVTKDIDNVSSPLNGLIIIAVVSYLTASIFLMLFDNAVMAMTTSLGVDLDLNNGEPQFGPPTFHEKSARAHVTKDNVVDQEEEASMSPRNNMM